MYASRNGHTDIVRELLSPHRNPKADINCVDKVISPVDRFSFLMEFLFINVV
jgi:hypothetical protein